MTKPTPSRLDQALADARADAEHKITEAEAVIAAQRGIIAALDRVAAQAGEAAAQAAKPAQPRQPPGAVENAVLDALARMAAAPCTAQDIVEASGQKAPSVRQALKRFVLVGEVTRDGDLYRLREKKAAE